MECREICVQRAHGVDMPMSTPNKNTTNSTPHRVCLCVTEDQARYLPRRHAKMWPNGAPLPRQGEVLYLSSSSAWGVTMVVHELRGHEVVTEVWLEHVGSSRQMRPTGFALTQ
jgi:hypothetical protein